MTLLRDGLLRERPVVIAGGVPEPVRARLVALGACVEELDLERGPESDPGLEEERARAWVEGRAPLRALVYDAAPAFAGGGQAALLASVEQAWIATRAVATGALIPSGLGGKVVLIAPRAEAGPLAGAARSALENVARTLSVEWARYAVTTTAVAPGGSTTERELAELVCFLVSPAGDYFSGCVLSLGTIASGPSAAAWG